MNSSNVMVFVMCAILCLCLIQTTNSQNVDIVDTPCSMRSGAPGICKPSINHCDLWAVQKEGITKCGTEGNNMMCCPTTSNAIDAVVDSPCTLQSGAPGICKASVHDCDAYELQKEGKPTSCGTGSEGSQMICCPMKQSISSRKCMEYSEKKKYNRTKSRLAIAAVIYNGEIVQNIEEYPHMALLGYNTGFGVHWYCGGTLISEQYILTAAHCLTSDRAPVSLVNLGFLNRSNRNVTTLQEFRVIGSVKHPNRTGRQWYNDAALLKLDRPVELTDAVFPACLHQDADIPATTVRAVGWGFTENSELSEELRKVNLTLVSHSDCAADFETERTLPNGIKDESQFCAGTNSKDTCNGDSGGPALIRHGNGSMNTVVGVTSLGILCDDNKGVSPSIFTRVSFIVPWIESIVWPNQ